MRRLTMLLALATADLAITAAVRRIPLRLDLTGSIPVGLYRVVRGPPVRGALVLACLPTAVARFARARGYVAAGGSCPEGTIPVGKVVVALPGDTVDVGPQGIAVDGHPIPQSAMLPRDSHGRSLPRLGPARVVVPSGVLWLLATWSPRSFDARYFGGIPADDVRARLRPVWVRTGP